MRLLILGAGGVGNSAAKIIKRAGEGGMWAEKVVVSDFDEARAKAVAEGCADERFVGEFVNAKDSESIKEVAKKHDITFVLNACPPNFNENIFDTCYDLGIGYMDCAMTLSKVHPEDPYNKCHIKLGDYQYAKDEDWKKKGILALAGSGVEPGMANVYAKYAEKYLFDVVHEVNVRDGDNYDGEDVGYFGFSVWTTIEECLNPPVVWEKDKGWFTTENFSEAEMFDFPGGIGEVEVINVEHEEVLMVPRHIDCERVTFKFGVPRELREILLNLREMGMAEAWEKIKIGDTEIAPRDFLCKVIPDPTEATLKMTGKGCAGTWVTGLKDGKKRSVYLYQVADNEECVKKYGTNAVVAQTAFNPVIMLELIATGKWEGVGVCNPEQFEPKYFVDLMAKYEFPGGMKEMDSEYADSINEQALAKIQASI